MGDIILQPIDGRTVVELDLGTDQSPDPLIVPGQFAFDWGRLDEPLELWKTCVLHLQAANRNLYETRLKPKLLGDRLVRFRLGINQGDTTLWRAWETHYLLGATLRAASTNATQAGYMCQLTLVDRLYTLNLDERLRAQQGVVSQLVQQMADDNGFAGSAIEPTRDKFSFIQSYQTDWDFLSDRLLSAANNLKGLGNYQLFARDDQLHFHTPGWQVAGIKQLLYNTPSAGATQLWLMDQGGLSVQQGAGGIRTVGYAPLSGESPSDQTSPSNALKLAQALPALAHVRTHLKHTGQNQLALTLSEAQNRYEAARIGVFRLSCQLPNQPFLRPGDIVQLQMSDPADAWSGLYHLTNSSLTLKGSRIIGVYALSRGEMNDVQQDFSSLKALDPSALVSQPHAAPGIAYNTAESATLSLTRGAGGSDEQGGVIVPIQPPGG